MRCPFSFHVPQPGCQVAIPFIACGGGIQQFFTIEGKDAVHGRRQPERRDAFAENDFMKKPYLDRSMRWFHRCPGMLVQWPDPSTHPRRIAAGAEPADRLRIDNEEAPGDDRGALPESGAVRGNPDQRPRPWPGRAAMGQRSVGLRIIGVAPRQMPHPSVHLCRKGTRGAAPAEQHAGAGGAATRLRAEDRPDAFQRSGAGHLDLNLAHSPASQPGKYWRIQHREGQHEGNPPAGHQIALRTACPEQRTHVLLRRQIAADP